MSHDLAASNSKLDAIEESKKTAAEEQARNGGLSAEDRDLQRALQLSEEEENKRKAAVASADQPGLFDQGNNLYARPSLCLVACLNFVQNQLRQHPIKY